MEYWSKILEEIKKSNIDLAAYWESFRLPTKKFLHEMARTFYALRVAISPESPSEKVRAFIGKNFTNAQLFKAIENCEELGIAVDVYFIAGLPGEKLDFYNSFKKIVESLSDKLWTAVFPPIIYVIDPNCIMALNPEKYGLKLYFKTFDDYRRMSVSLNRLDKIGYETSSLSRKQILELTDKAKNYVKSLPPPLMRTFLW